MTVTATPSLPVNSAFDVHRVLAAWGEGGGVGAAAANGEASWTDRLGPGTAWATAGGDFKVIASALQNLTGNGAYDFTSASLAADVQFWLNNPSGNFGWLLRSESETTAVTILKFGSRSSLAGKPKLMVNFIPLPIPKISDLARAGNQIRFSFDAEPNRPYVVEFRDSLTAGDWGVMTNYVALPATTTLHYTNSVSTSERYCRIRTP